jgi:hypothetical protein
MSEERTNKHTETHACDSISRQKAIDTVKKMRAVCDTDSIEDYEALLETAFEALPSEKPEKVYVSEIMLDAEMFQRTVERIAEKARKELDLQILGGE